MSDDKGVGLRGWLSGPKSKGMHAESKPSAILLERRRVAVLPLANISSNPRDEYFSDGMTEELISTLANVSGLTVISRASIMHYKNTSKNALEIGRDLAAGSILEGSVRKAGNQLRISVQLIDTQEDKHLWAQTYDRELKDIFAVQSDIARNVSEALRVKLLPRRIARPKKNATQNMEAYTLYLRGRFHWNKRTKESIKKALENFQEAIHHDPTYALAYTGVADCYYVIAGWGYGPAKESISNAKEASLKALELNSDLAEAHASLAFALLVEWNWAASEAELKRAIELNPNYAFARQLYSWLLAILGRPDEALFEAKKACEIDPLSPRITSNLGELFSQMGEYDLAIDLYKKALEIQPDFYLAHTNLSQAYAKKSMFDEALAECQKIDSLRESDPATRLDFAYVYALCGRRDDARRILQENMKNIDAESTLLLETAKALSALGDKNDAIELLYKGYESHNHFLFRINTNDFHNLLSDPRFIMLKKKMGLRK